ncbi:cache domain-containing protein [Pontivivens insulae]|uniref:Oxygen sensor histidine kinase NreB n=1 Tax=Pontivivens insulae TaxID=1639689 RepID=A0A2R8AAL6_9RHOB|nr:cache domain-containing protein [Pontivivens insulae]RED13157.1 two-component system NarL family sensor kinase [Pontivivens insulae]SPF29249.1 Oxygen sensor histidine kinase NreB [Pontivivens insulae]
MSETRKRLRPNYGQKIFLLATLPLMLAVAAIAALVAYQSRQLAEEEIAFLEETLIETKEAELRNYMSLARNAIYHIYGPAGPDDEQAKTEAAQILAAMTYGNDGYFFVYQYDGTNLVSSRQTELITRNWADLTDSTGQPVVQPLIDLARSGGGYHEYLWPKPSTGEETPMVSYVIGLQDWRWAVGTGIFIDDVLAEVANARAALEERIRSTFYWIAAITLAVLLGVFASGMFINLRERRLADGALAILTQRIVDTQEEERARVARELHDGISQILVSIRYGLELARRKLITGADDVGNTLDKSSDGLNMAIQEVRRISRDLRPAALDDLGLSPALKTLCEEFEERTGVPTRIDTVALRNSLTAEGKTALYRVAQEALTNIERYAHASEVVVHVRPHRTGIKLTITDNGVGFVPGRGNGLGLRNMTERIEHLGGTFRVLSSKDGTRIEANLPSRHLRSGAPTQERKSA